MARNLQLGIESNWSLQYSNSFSAVIFTDQEGNPVYTKITEIKPLTVFDKPIIAVSINTAVPVGRIWNYAGYLRRTVTTAFGESFVGEPENLFLGKFNLIVFDDLNIDYFVLLQVPKWFRNANIAIYQYEGVDTTTLEDDVQAIKTSLGI
ncbi:hypothetical protein NIES25_48300 [Nostoc linckia NIES-25]|nr:hypothetical protein NIES25_48300 [Nostoc linckia NIES-25]